MAKQTQTKETVALVSPKGTRVTVAADSAAKFKAKGYKAPSSRSAGTSADAKAAADQK